MNLVGVDPGPELQNFLSLCSPPCYTAQKSLCYFLVKHQNANFSILQWHMDIPKASLNAEKSQEAGMFQNQHGGPVIEI